MNEEMIEATSQEGIDEKEEKEAFEKYQSEMKGAEEHND